MNHDHKRQEFYRDGTATMQLIDPNHPIYRPLWVRLLIVGICAAWTVVEIITGEPFWVVIVGAMAIYSAYVLLFTFKPSPPEAEKPAVDPDEGDDNAR